MKKVVMLLLVVCGLHAYDGTSNHFSELKPVMGSLNIVLMMSIPDAITLQRISVF